MKNGGEKKREEREQDDFKWGLCIFIIAASSLSPHHPKGGYGGKKDDRGELGVLSALVGERKEKSNERGREVE